MTARLRLLLATDAVGGVWTYSLDLAGALSRLGVDCRLAVLGPSPDPAQREAAQRAGIELVDTGLPLDWVTEDPAELDRSAHRLAELAEEMEADLVQLHSPALAIPDIFSVPLVVVHHSCVATWWDAVRGTALPEDFVWRTERAREGLHHADAVITPSVAYGKMVQARYRLERAPVAVHNGRVPLRQSQAAAHDFAFTAGRLWDEGKNVATLDAAASRLAIPVHAAGPLHGPNGARAAFPNLHCLGQIGEREMARWLSARPVFVSCALYEPFGLSVLEAALAGCPLVLSDIPTFRELWDGAAIFVDPRDSDGFARIISDLAGDDFQRAVRGRAARDRAAAYTPAAMAERMVQVYRRLVAAKAAPDPRQLARAAA